jgi:hypothetical protein
MATDKGTTINGISLAPDAQEIYIKSHICIFSG